MEHFWMKPYRVAAAVALIGALGLGGCQSASKALGMNKVTPDEFRVVTKAPLIVPPDFSLRPPAHSDCPAARGAACGRRRCCHFVRQ